MDGAIEILFSNSYDASSIVHGVDSYLVCDDDVAKLMERAAGTFVNLDLLTDIVIRKFFSLKDLRNAINIHIFSVDFMADLVSRAIPKEWRNVESAVVSVYCTFVSDHSVHLLLLNQFIFLFEIEPSGTLCTRIP